MDNFFYEQTPIFLLPILKTTKPVGSYSIAAGGKSMGARKIDMWKL